MKNLFKTTSIVALVIGSFSFANIKAYTNLYEKIPSQNLIIQSPFNDNESILSSSAFGYGCKTFHVKVNIGIAEVETDVTICAGCPSTGGPCGIKVSKMSNNPDEKEDLSFGAMDLSKILSDKRFADAKEIEVLESSSETSDDITLTVKKGTYKIVKDDKGSGAIVNLERVK